MNYLTKTINRLIIWINSVLNKPNNTQEPEKQQSGLYYVDHNMNLILSTESKEFKEAAKNISNKLSRIREEQDKYFKGLMEATERSDKSITIPNKQTTKEFIDFICDL